MSLQTSIEFPEADVRRFARALGRLQGDMGKSEASALRSGFKALLASLSASTDVSPKYRDYQDTGRKSRRGTSRIFEVESKFPSRKFETRAKSVADLKKQKAVVIGRRGLAKKSWQIAGKKGRIKTGETVKGAALASSARQTNKMVGEFVTVQSQLKGHDKFMRVSNRVSYMMHALQAGSKSVNTALARASRKIEKDITKALGKKLDKQLGFKF